LDAYHPAPLHLFSTLDRDITLAFIADYPTPAQATTPVTRWLAPRGPLPCPLPGTGTS
jgi:hypothetical protein